MSHVFHRDPRRDYPVAVRGEGAYLVDREGRRYLDASGGAAVSCLGHSDRVVSDAIARQVAKLPYAHTSFFSNEPMEAALKLARQYFVEKGEPGRVHFIARRQSYHGNSLGALAVGGNRWRRAPFEPLLVGASHVAPCYPYRDRLTDETADAYVARLAAELEREIARLGPKAVIGFVAETVAGATL